MAKNNTRAYAQRKKPPRQTYANSTALTPDDPDYSRKKADPETDYKGFTVDPDGQPHRIIK